MDKKEEVIINKDNDLKFRKDLMEEHEQDASFKESNTEGPDSGKIQYFTE